MRKIDQVLTEMQGFRTEVRSDLRAVSARIDALNGRVDTVIDSIADLRRDFEPHTHEN